MMQAKSLSLRAEGQDIFLLDQTQLPHKEHWLKIDNTEQMILAIKKLQVRGAPLIGVAAAFSIAQSAQKGTAKDKLLNEAQALYEARPTAVNLMICVDRMKNAIHKNPSPEYLTQVAQEIFNEDVELCERIAHHGQKFIATGDNILTHCNTGGLATAGIGTALGVILKAHQLGKKVHVWVDETRPLLQGGRLTAWECEKLEIPYTLITDNMAAHVMSQGRIQKAVVGSDRIALNGDFANKIGTYSVAINCDYHQIPFFVAAPWTTVDVHCPSGNEIPIEERKPQEVQGVSGSFGEVLWAPRQAKVYNPAFDVTPAKLISGWILDQGSFTKQDIQNGALKTLRN